MNLIDAKVDLFFKKYKHIEFKKGDFILEPKESIPFVFYLEKGLVKQFSYSEEGKEITIHVFEKGSYFPIMLVLSNAQNTYYFQADSEVEVYRAPTNEVIDFLKNEPEIVFDLATRFAIALSKMSQRLQNLLSLNSFSKVVSILLYLASRFGKSNKNQVVIEQAFTHHDIATWTGITRETASRSMEKLAKMGIIDNKSRQIVIKDLPKLKSLIQT